MDDTRLLIYRGLVESTSVQDMPKAQQNVKPSTPVDLITTSKPQKSSNLDWPG